MKKYLLCLVFLFLPLLVISCNSNSKANETTQIFLGGYHSSLITQDGNLYFWGRNMYGGLGDGTTVSKSTPIDITSELNLKFRETVIQMSLGTHHSSILTSTGRLFTWGNNTYGQLGDNTTTNRLTPVDITSQFDLSNDEVIIQVSFSGVSSSAITSDGRIFTWGGQTSNIGIIIPESVPIDKTSEFDLKPEEKIV